MPNYICVTCGVQYAETAGPPAHCRICEDDRQYVGHAGQQWTTLADMRRERRNAVEPVEPGLFGVRSDPLFAIAQRAMLIRTPAGNVLWDCISLLDGATVDAVRELGGLRAIAISHPHFYSSMAEWSRAFNVPIYLHAANADWVMRRDAEIVYWDGDTFALDGGLTLIRCGGHFPGSTALHWPAGAGGRGALLTGDTLYVVSDRRYVTFMYSFPNYIPLNAEAVRGIVRAVAPFAFDRIYSAWPERVMDGDARAGVGRSAERYLNAIGADPAGLEEL